MIDTPPKDTKPGAEAAEPAEHGTTQSPTIGALAGALAAVQGEIRDAYKAKEGHGYNYADLASILEIVRPLCSRNGIAVFQHPFDAGPGRTGVETMLAHTSGEWIRGRYSMPVEPANKRMNTSQAVGAVVTYARRYALAAALGIAQHDNDAALVDYVSDGELAEMRRLIEQTSTDAARVCAHYGIEDLAEMTRDAWGGLRRVLTNKARTKAEVDKKNAARADDLKSQVRGKLDKG
jgi:hypothetical protein